MASNNFAMIESLLRKRPEAQEFIRRHSVFRRPPLDTLARYIITYGVSRAWWASLGAPHTTPAESHGAGESEKQAVEDLLDNLHRIP